MSAHVFLSVFLGLALGAGFSSGLGRPLFASCLRPSKSLSVTSNIAFTPIYLTGLYPRRASLFLAESVVIPIRMPISPTVNSYVFIPPILYGKRLSKQEISVKMSAIWLFILFICIVVLEKKCKIFKKFSLSLDRSHGQPYSDLTPNALICVWEK